MKRRLWETAAVLIVCGLYVGKISADPEGRSRPCTGIVDQNGVCQPSPAIPIPPAAPEPQGSSGMHRDLPYPLGVT